MKRLLLGLSCVLVVACSVPPTQQLAGTEVITESGRISGVGNNPHVVRWLNIPYAQPPVGGLRWRAPQPLAASDARIVSPAGPVMCSQQASQTAGLEGDGMVGNEDCLYLDIVAPRDYATEQYPVMFWIHGGANTSGYKGTYDFSALAEREKVVVVTINYRLGVLGWFTHPALTATGQGLDASGNFGTLDIIAALSWTQRNIAGFGGDPGNVTIFGESAGGRNVYSMLASPLSAGLFHKAIAQSPTAQSYTPREAYNAQREYPHVARGAWEVVDQLGLDHASLSADALRAIPTEALLREYFGIVKDHAEPLIIADGAVIPAQGLVAGLADPRFAKNVPVMSGSNRDEVSLWLGLNRYFVDGKSLLFGLLPPKVSIRNPELYHYWVRQRARGWKVRAVDEPLANLEAAGYTDLFAYRFDWDEQDDNWFVPFSKVLGAAHGSEIAFVMGAPMYGSVGEYMYPETDSAREMTAIMMSAWGEFARNGAPDDVNGVAWPRFNTDAPHIMVLDAGEDASHVAVDSPGLDGLLQEIAMTESKLDAQQTCILVWELLTNVGDAAYGDYERWDDGRCSGFDVPAEKAAVRAALTEQYGSPDIF